MTIFPSIMLWAALALGYSSLPGGLNQYTATANPGETFTYDADGNLTQDAKFDYTWDAENRLASVTARNPAAGSKKLVLTYDAAGRRIRKQAYTWSTGGIGGPPGWGSAPTLDRKFIYDGWNLIEELNALSGNAVVARYAWGLDLSGQAGNPSTSGMHAAGGVGGILSMYDAAGAKSHLYYFNGNGDVGQLMDVSNGATSARYEMYPYGGELVATGSAATVNPFRFSSKYWDGEQQAYYYGYRYLKPKMGRWLNRDPIGEMGGWNLYRSLDNGPTANIDPLGESIEEHFEQGEDGSRYYVFHVYAPSSWLVRLFYKWQYGGSAEELVGSVLCACPEGGGLPADVDLEIARLFAKRLEGEAQLERVKELIKDGFKGAEFTIRVSSSAVDKLCDIAEAIHDPSRRNIAVAMTPLGSWVLKVGGATLKPTLGAIARHGDNCDDGLERLLKSRKTAPSKCDALEKVAAREPKLIGKVTPPADLMPGTCPFGNAMHKSITDMLKTKYPGVNFTFNVKPGQTGIDITVPRSQQNRTGFERAEIKPRTPSGESSLNRQLDRWGCERSEIKVFTYDACGNIYDEF